MAKYSFIGVKNTPVDNENSHITLRCMEAVESNNLTTIYVRLDGELLQLKMSGKVKKDKEIYPPFVPIHFFAKKKSNYYFVTHICSDVLFHAVNNTEGEPLLTLMKLDMLVSEKEQIADQLELLSSSSDKSKEMKSNPGVSGKPELIKKYGLIKGMLSQNEDAVVNKWLYHPTQSAKDERKLECFLNSAANYMYRPTTVSDEQLKKTFDNDIFGLDKAKQIMIQKLARKPKAKGARGNRILIVGSSGCGKTALANAYALASKLPHTTVELSAVSSALDLKGCLSTYDGADFGVFLKAFRIYNTSEMVFILENLDKIPSGDGDRDGKPMDVIAAIVANQHTFTDAYMELPIDISNTDFIITACSTENIPYSVLDNCSVIRLTEYSFEERVNIAREVLLPTLYLEGEYEFDYPVISDKLLMYIARNYCCDDGVKDLNRHLKTLLEQLPSIGKINKKTIDKVLSPMVDEKNPGLRLNRNYDGFTPELVKEIRKTIQKTQSSLVNDKEKGLEKMRLDYLLKAAKTPCAKINMKQFKKEINQSHFGMEKVKEKIIDAFTSQETFGTLRSILLVGPAGIGKTTISRTIAHASGKTFKKISLNGLDHPSLLRGSTKTHKNADAGEVIKAVCDASSNTVLLMDEVDKMNPSLANTILDLIDEYLFTDDFIGVPFDLSNVLFIFTANDASRISPYLYDRFDTVIYLDGYDHAQRMQIARDYVIPEINREYKLCHTILRELLSTPKTVAVGETGLDYHRNVTCDEDKDLQKAYFRLQIELALEYNMPLILHIRDCHEDALDILENYGKPFKGVCHCFIGGADIAKCYTDLGFYLGIGGSCTYSGKGRFEDFIRDLPILPMNRIVLETDAPYLLPSGCKGKRNTSLNLSVVVSTLAQAQNMTMEDVEEITERNAEECFFKNVSA